MQTVLIEGSLEVKRRWENSEEKRRRKKIKKKKASEERRSRCAKGRKSRNALFFQ